MDSMKKISILCILIGLAATSAMGRKVRVKHKIDTHKSTVSTDTMSDYANVSLAPDSVGWEDAVSKINLYGFDKTVNSSKESLFAVNGLDSCAIAEMTLDIVYLDMKGRQLHRMEVSLDCDIPAGETRRVDFPSWDSQKAFYYHKSAAPKKQATPFSVKVSLKSLTLIPNPDP